MIIKKRNMQQKSPAVEQKAEAVVLAAKAPQKEEIDIFDLDNIDFSQRQERRRGDRRRGYRRIDDRNLISRAQEEAETIKESAAKEGYKLGVEEAQTDIAEVREAIKDFQNAKQEVFDKVAADIMEISVDIAEKIIKKELTQDPAIIMNTIEDVLKSIPKEETKITLKVNPSQSEYIKTMLPELISISGTEAKIHVVPEETIEEGGCIFHTSNGIVDATLRTRLEVIKEALKGI